MIALPHISAHARIWASTSTADHSSGAGRVRKSAGASPAVSAARRGGVAASEARISSIEGELSGIGCSPFR